MSRKRLKLEITESVLLSETAHGMANLNFLREQGIAIILDDFGTGYSSLSYLKRFHFDEIKIDKSFIDDLGNHIGSTAIVAATITLARELDIVTTAEGVETEDQRLLLQASGVQQLQGYLFGKPAPAAFWTFLGTFGETKISRLIRCRIDTSQSCQPPNNHLKNMHISWKARCMSFRRGFLGVSFFININILFAF